MPQVIVRFGSIFFAGDYGGPTSNADLIVHQCDSGPAMDQAMRSLYRVKSWKLTISYTREDGTTDDDGNFSASGSSQVDVEFVSTGLTSNTTAPIDDEAHAMVPGVVAYWQADNDDGEDGCDAVFNLSLVYSTPLDMWVLVPSFNLTSYEVEIGGDSESVAEISSATISEPDDSDDIDQGLLSFLGKTWPATKYQEMFDTDDDEDPDDHSTARITLTSLKLEPKEYWTYGGTYDGDTGELA